MTFANLRYLLIAMVLVSVIIYLGSMISSHLGAIEMWFESIGNWALLAFIVVFVLITSLLVPESVLSIIAGALFGFKIGITVVLTAMISACIFQYWLAKSSLRDPINKKLQSKPKFLAIQKAVLKDELRLQFLLRLTPLNPAIISYLLGAAGVKLKGFVLACFAMVPLLCVEVYIGVLGKSSLGSNASSNTENVASTLQNSILIVGLVVSIVVIYFISKIARKAIDEASVES